MDLSRLNGRGRIATWALCLYAVLCGVFLVSDLHRFSVISAVAGILNPPVPNNIEHVLAVQSSAQSSDHLTKTLALITLIGFLICALVFVRWFREAYRNVTAFGFHPRYTLGQATYGWIIPVVSLALPKVVADDIWRGSDPHRDSMQGLGTERVATILNLWWGLWVLSDIFFVISRLATHDYTVTNTPTISSLRSTTDIHLVFDVTNAVGAILATRVIAEINRRQSARVATLNLPVAAPAVSGLGPTVQVDVPQPGPTDSVPPPGF